MIDDEIEMYNSVKNYFAENNISILHKQSLDEALILLNEDSFIFGIILDAKGFLDRNQKPGTESLVFFHEAFRKIGLLEREKNITYPKIVFTGFRDTLVETYSGKIYSKTEFSQTESVRIEIVNYFKEYRRDEPLFNLYNKHYKLFELLFKIEASKQIIDYFKEILLFEFKSSNQSPPYNIIRQAYEGWLDYLVKYKILPFSFNNGSRRLIQPSALYLCGLPCSDIEHVNYPRVEHRIPFEICHTSLYLSNISNYGSHHFPKDNISEIIYESTKLSILTLYYYLEKVDLPNDSQFM